MGRLLHRLACAALSFAAAFVLVSCGADGYDNSVRGPLELSLTRILADLRAQSVTVGVTARGAGWSVEGLPEWCVADRTSGDEGSAQITLSIAANEGDAARTATLIFRSGSEEKSVPVEQLNTSIEPNLHVDAPINKAIHAHLARWYYNGEPAEPSAAPDLNQSWDDFYENYLSHLSRNTFDGKLWAQDNIRHLYSYIERRPAAETGPLLNYGMEFDLGLHNNALVARVLYVEKGSPAETAGLKRGDWFNRVNGTRLELGTTSVGDFRYYYNRVIDSLVHPVADHSPVLSMMSYSGATELLTESSTKRTLVPRRFVGTPVFGTQTFAVERLPVDSRNMARVGYMMYNRFDRNYENELVAAFRDVFAQGHGGGSLSEFILDLRYNKSGAVETAELMGNLLVGNLEGVAGKTFAKYEFSALAPASAGRTAQFAAHADGIAPRTVYVLTSRHTAGAAELLINALRGLDQSVVKLVVIGETSRGMAAGMVERSHTADGLVYRANMLAFRCLNDAAQGDYTSGFVPNGGEVDEWKRGDNIKWSTTWGWKEQEGATQDQMVKRAVDIIRGSATMPVAGVVNASDRQRGGYPREFCFPTNMMMTVSD